METHDLFFPLLRRRESYKTKKDGDHYADYNKYRQEIREDCLGRCVYCDSHENEIGGPESMKLDHFRPKKHFEHLVNDPHNLVWSCESCNRKKWDHWPALGISGTVLNGEGFIDPFEENRLEYFEVCQDGELIPLKPPATYMISLLVLNRILLKTIRKWRYQAQELLPRLELEITKLEQIDTLTDEQKNLLDILSKSKGMNQERLDFSLR